MITVLHVIESLDEYGGTPRKLLYLAKHYDNSRTKLGFLTYQDSSLLPQFIQSGVDVYETNSRLVYRIAQKVVAASRLNNADVICTHFSRPLAAGYLAARVTGLPFIHCEHSSARYREGIARIMARYCLPRASAVVCNSHHTARSIAAAYPISHDRLRVLYNPVEKRECRVDRESMRSDLNCGPSDFVIGHVGGMIPSRDQLTLIRAFHEVRRLYDNTRLVLIGDGPMRREIEKLVGDLKLCGAVEIVGYTDRVGDYLGAMDIYVNPTLDEGFGIAVAEAMLSGVPVVCANAGAHPELITDGQDGVLYSAGDINALRDALVALICNSARRQRLGAAAAESARGRFSPALYARGFVDIAKQVVVDHESRIAPASGSAK